MTLDDLIRRSREIAHAACPRCTGGKPGAVMLADASERYHSTKCEKLASSIAELAAEWANATRGERKP